MKSGTLLVMLSLGVIALWGWWRVSVMLLGVWVLMRLALRAMKGW